MEKGRYYYQCNVLEDAENAPDHDAAGAGRAQDNPKVPKSKVEKLQETVSSH